MNATKVANAANTVLSVSLIVFQSGENVFWKLYDHRDPDEETYTTEVTYVISNKAKDV